MRTTQDAIATPDIVEPLLTLGSFLVWANESGARYGGVEADEALDALRDLMGWDTQTYNRFVTAFNNRGEK
jgi:hypothetical protein